jgi:hypothetical protein
MLKKKVEMIDHVRSEIHHTSLRSEASLLSANRSSHFGETVWFCRTLLLKLFLLLLMSPLGSSATEPKGYVKLNGALRGIVKNDAHNSGLAVVPDLIVKA